MALGPDLESVRQGAREEGRAAGREEGHAAGREEGELALVLWLLERRIGPVSEAARQRLAGLDREGLTVLAESVSELNGPADLDAWLSARHPG